MNASMIGSASVVEQAILRVIELFELLKFKISSDDEDSTIVGTASPYLD